MKIACVLVTHLRMKAELRRHAHLRSRPAVIVDGSQSRPLVLDSTPEASGVTVGIALEDALSHRADTIVLEADEPYYQKIFDQLIEALLQISDRVEKAGLGCAYVQLDGLELLYGGEERLVALLRQAVPDDLNPRIGIAEAKFPAFVSALQGRGAPTARGTDSTTAFLRPLSVDLLPISSEDKGLLHDFGIHTMEQVGSLSIGVLQAQFGMQGKSIWELAKGVDNSPLVPVVREESVTEYISLPYAGVTTDVFFATLDSLAKRAFARPHMKGRYVGKAAVQCSIFQSPTWTKDIAFKDPAGSWERLTFGIRSHIDMSELPGIPEDILLTISNFTPERGRQSGFLDKKEEREHRARKLEEVDRLLQIRAGGKPALYHSVEADPGHPIPEMRSFLISLDPSVPASIKPLKSPTPMRVTTDDRNKPTGLYRSKRSRRRIEIDGVLDLWRINLWWLARPVERTYYELEQEDGRLVTVFRDRDDNWFQQDY